MRNNTQIYRMIHIISIFMAITKNISYEIEWFQEEHILMLLVFLSGNA